MLWWKSLHIISMVAWFAGLFYLPRLFVYHANAPIASSTAQLFQQMERRLYYYIMYPAALLTWTAGLALLHTPAGQQMSSQAWMHLKLFLVLCLSLYHFYLGRCLKHFKQTPYPHTATFYRFLNEFPTVCLIPIVFLVVMKPW